ncbi:MAG TPA: DUF6084 family protein [Bryobacteraceae bacterium]|nr:DUF6084 family protein [Bryobacteraceae bacterium]
MTDLSFEVMGAKPVPYAVTPAIAFRLRVRERRAIQAMLLHCQLRIEPRCRAHARDEQERLIDVFGAPERWGETLHALPWTQATIHLPPFEGAAEVDLPVACTYDFEVTAAKYLASLEGGEIPLRFLFSGTIFVKSAGGFMVEQVPWNKDAVWRLPVSAWRELMDAYFPGTAWIRLRRETLDLLQRERARNGFVSWDETIETILKGDLKCAPLVGPSR